jgi:hypothetical protein
MSAPSTFNFLPKFEPGKLFSGTAGRSGVRPVSRDADLDEAFRLMREECARTLTLMRGLRTSPLYRFASVDPCFDEGQ